MSTMTNDFDGELSALLNGALAPMAKDEQDPHGPAVGHAAHERAVAEAMSHETCAPDGRTKPIFIAVIGSDGEVTVQEVPVGVNVSCVVGAYAQDDDVVSIAPMGFEQDAEPFHDHENDPALRPRAHRIRYAIQQTKRRVFRA